MKKCLLIVTVMLVICGSLFSLDSSIYYQLGVVPQFEQDLIIGSWDLLNFEYDEFSGETLLDFNVNADYELWLQDMNWDVFLTDSVYLTFAGDFASASDPAGGVGYYGGVEATRYFSGVLPFPVQVHGEIFAVSDIVLDEFGMSPDIYDEIGWTAGVGIGRLINVRPVAQIIAVTEKLGLSVSQEQIIDAARILAKGGEYDFLYREKSDEEYYGAIADILGVEDSMQVRRALIDTGTIVSRSVGYDLRLLYSQAHLGFGFDEPSVYLLGELGVPIGLHTQFTPQVFAGATRDSFSSEWITYADVRVLFGFDHSNDWSSYVGSSARFFQGGDLVLELTMGTGVQVLEKLYVGLDYLYFLDPDDGQYVGVNLSLRYYVF